MRYDDRIVLALFLLLLLLLLRLLRLIPVEIARSLGSGTEGKKNRPVKFHRVAKIHALARTPGTSDARPKVLLTALFFRQRENPEYLERSVYIP